jgi:hypothetical protein
MSTFISPTASDMMHDGLHSPGGMLMNSVSLTFEFELVPSHFLKADLACLHKKRAPPRPLIFS